MLFRYSFPLKPVIGSIRIGWTVLNSVSTSTASVANVIWRRFTWQGFHSSSHHVWSSSHSSTSASTLVPRATIRPSLPFWPFLAHGLYVLLWLVLVNRYHLLHWVKALLLLLNHNTWHLHLGRKDVRHRLQLLHMRWCCSRSLRWLRNQLRWWHRQCSQWGCLILKVGKLLNHVIVSVELLGLVIVQYHSETAEVNSLLKLNLRANSVSHFRFLVYHESLGFIFPISRLVKHFHNYLLYNFITDFLSLL